MKFEKVNMPLNENLYNKLNNMCIFNNLKLEYKNGIIFRVADTNVNFIEPHRFIIKVNDIALVLLCYDNLNLYLYDKDIAVNVPLLKELIEKIIGRRRFGVTLLSTPEYYLFSEEEAKAVYYNLIKFIKYKYGNSNYDYSILVGLSNVDGKSVDYKYKCKGVGRPSYEFMARNKIKGIRYVNWHLHIMVFGATIGIMVKDIEDNLQKILNKKLSNEEFDKKVYDSPNFNKYYFNGYKKELDVLMSSLLRKRKSS